MFNFLFFLLECIAARGFWIVVGFQCRSTCCYFCSSVLLRNDFGWWLGLGVDQLHVVFARTYCCTLILNGGWVWVLINFVLFLLERIAAQCFWMVVGFGRWSTSFYGCSSVLLLIDFEWWSAFASAMKKALAASRSAPAEALSSWLTALISKGKNNGCWDTTSWSIWRLVCEWFSAPSICPVCRLYA